MLIAFIAPALWALVNVVDLFLVKRRIFKDEFEAAGVIGILGVPPAILVVFRGVSQIDLTVAGMAVFGGVLFTVCTFFLFRSLFRSDDVALVAVFMNLSGLVVPLLAMIIWNETLTLVQYVAIALTVVGSIRLNRKNSVVDGSLRRIIMPMSMSVLAISLSMVMEERVYKMVGFHDGLPLFSLGIFIGGVFFCMRMPSGWRRAYRTIATNGVMLMMTEGINLLATVSSQYAISISPGGASFIATIETTHPVFVLLISWISLVFCKMFGLGDWVLIFREQFAGFRGKFLAVLLMLVGVCMLR